MSKVNSLVVSSKRHSMSALCTCPDTETCTHKHTCIPNTHRHKESQGELGKEKEYDSNQLLSKTVRWDGPVHKSEFYGL